MRTSSPKEPCIAEHCFEHHLPLQQTEFNWHSSYVCLSHVDFWSVAGAEKRVPWIRPPNSNVALRLSAELIQIKPHLSAEHFTLDSGTRNAFRTGYKQLDGRNRCCHHAALGPPIETLNLPALL
jgi:hypothetical protein